MDGSKRERGREAQSPDGDKVVQVGPPSLGGVVAVVIIVPQMPQ